MSEPYEVVVTIPEEPELTVQEQESLKDSFRASLLETLQGRTEAAAEVEVQLITGSSTE